jgi:hypothetical protein
MMAKAMMIAIEFEVANAIVMETMIAMLVVELAVVVSETRKSQSNSPHRIHRTTSNRMRLAETPPAAPSQGASRHRQAPRPTLPLRPPVCKHNARNGAVGVEERLGFHCVLLLCKQNASDDAVVDVFGLFRKD